MQIKNAVTHLVPQRELRASLVPAKGTLVQPDGSVPSIFDAIKTSRVAGMEDGAELDEDSGS